MYTLVTRTAHEDHPQRCKPISQSFPVCKMDFLWLAIVAIVIIFFVCCLERLYRYYKRTMPRIRTGESTWSRTLCCCLRRRPKMDAKTDATEGTSAAPEASARSSAEKEPPSYQSTDPYLTKPWSSFNRSLLMEEGRIERPKSIYAPRSPDVDNRSSSSGTTMEGSSQLSRNPSTQSRRSPTLKPLLLCERNPTSSSSTSFPSRTPSTSSRTSLPILPLTRPPTPPTRLGRARAGTVVSSLPLAPPCAPFPLATRGRHMGLLAPAMVSQPMTQ